MAGATYGARGVRGSDIVAVAEAPDGLDHLTGSSTIVADCRDLTLLPAFEDVHEHLLEAARNSALVPVERARSIAEFCDAIAAAARSAPPHQWVQTSVAWHESNLREGRLPTRAELDAASPAHPVLARRGGHLAVANSTALAQAGINGAAPDSPGGRIGRDTDREPNGLLEGAAVYRVATFAPPVPPAVLMTGINRTSAQYAALGVGTVREAMIGVDELGTYQSALEAGELHVRVRPSSGSPTMSAPTPRSTLSEA
jgi:predicted amidohydrolase YtcJ